MTPADRPILQALRLPAMYVITPADVMPDQHDEWGERIHQAIQDGVRLLQLHLPLWPVTSVRSLAVELLPITRKHGAQLLLNDDIEGGQALGVGAHLTSEQLLNTSERPLPWHQLISVSCHDASQLAKATEIRADFATLPWKTASVGGTDALRAEEMVRLPVIGGRSFATGVCHGRTQFTAPDAGKAGWCPRHGGYSGILADLKSVV